MLLMAAFYSVGLALFGFDLAVPVGVFTGLAIFVPYVGFGIGQIVEGLFLTPKMVGERIGMSPLTVIFALFAFGHLLGFVGVLIALPASSARTRPMPKPT